MTSAFQVVPDSDDREGQKHGASSSNELRGFEDIDGCLAHESSVLDAVTPAVRVARLGILPAVPLIFSAKFGGVKFYPRDPAAFEKVCLNLDGFLV